MPASTLSAPNPIKDIYKKLVFFEFFACKSGINPICLSRIKKVNYHIKWIWELK